jgi:hypothetical protein
MAEIALALGSTAISAAGAASTGGLTFFSLTGTQAFMAHFAVRAALGYALNALAANQKVPTSRGYQNVNQLGPALPHQIIYGETRVGGAIFYQVLDITDDRYLYRCIAFAGHEIDSYQAIYVNDEEVTIDANGNVTSGIHANQIKITKYLGTDDQLANEDLLVASPEWSSRHTAKGVAYIVARFYRASNFPNGVPTITARIRGKKVYDPRTSTTAWSDNPALIIRDYLTSDYGLEEIDANINSSKFIDAANACDDLYLGEKTYTCNGSFLLDSSPEDNIRNLLSSMGGTFWNFAGTWAILAAEERDPVLELTEDDMRGDLEIATRFSRRDNFNVVKGQYKGEASNDQPDNFKEVSSGIYLAEDNGIRAISELNLLFTDNEPMARRIARRYLRRNRRQITVSGSFGLRALDLTIGDNVTLTSEHLGFSQKLFEVVDWRMGMQDLQISVTMILREMDNEVFTGRLGVLEDEVGNTLLDESGNSLEAIVA